MSVRTLLNWMKLDPEAEPPKEGRPPHSETARREAYRAVRCVLKTRGPDLGEERVLEALSCAVPRRLVREALCVRKRWHRRREARRLAAHRVSIRPVAPGALASLDGFAIGWVAAGRVIAEQVVDVLSTKTLAAKVGPPPCGEDVVELLERLRTSADGLPLACLLDRGPENKNACVGCYAAKHHLVLIYNVAYTPEHNPACERKNRDVRAVSDLRPWTLLESLKEGQRRVHDALIRLDFERPRRKHGGRTAVVRDAEGRVRYTPGFRAALWRDVCTAQEAAARNCARPRDRPRAERNAALGVLQEYGLIEWTRGGVRIRCA